MTAMSREDAGTRHARRLRDQGRLPAVIYGHGEGTVSISLDQHDVELALQHGARTMNVKIDGKPEQQCLIKDVQYDFLDTTPIHLDLTRVDLHERVQVTVGIELRGTPKGVAQGGVLDQVMAEIEVECMVSNIPDTYNPLVAELDIGDTLQVKDLDLGEGVKALADPEEVICTVQVLAEEVEPEEDVEVEVGEEEEPERIGRVRKEDEEESSD